MQTQQTGNDWLNRIQILMCITAFMGIIWLGI